MKVQFFGMCNHCLGDLRNEKGFRKITRKSLSEWIHEDCLEKQQAGESPKRPKHADDMASYEGGAKRSSKLPRYELIDPTFLHEVAEVFGASEVKYGEGNWQKGEQEYVQDIPRHMLLHVFGIMSGDTSENHLAHLICNGIMLAKLRKKYPYQVPGAPEQLNLDALLNNPAVDSVKVEVTQKFKLASLESQLERIEKSTREFPQTFQENIRTDTYEGVPEGYVQFMQKMQPAEKLDIKVQFDPAATKNPHPKWKQDRCKLCADGVPLRGGYRDGHNLPGAPECTAPEPEQYIDELEGRKKVEEVNAAAIFGQCSICNLDMVAGQGYCFDGRSSYHYPTCPGKIKENSNAQA